MRRLQQLQEHSSISSATLTSELPVGPEREEHTEKLPGPEGLVVLLALSVDTSVLHPVHIQPSCVSHRLLKDSD